VITTHHHILLRISTSWTAVVTNAVDPEAGDIRSFLTSEDQKHLLSALVILTFFILTFLTPSTKVGKQHCLLGAGFFFIYLFRTGAGSCTVAGFPVRILPEIGLDFSIPSVTKARIVYILIAGIIVDAVLQRLKWISDDFISKYTQNWIPSPAASVVNRNAICKLSCLRIFSTAFVLMSALLMRVELIPLLGLNVLTEKLIHQIFPAKDKSPLLIVITYLTAGTSAFYAQGNSNSISTIDISSGYIGLESYHLPLVSLLVVLSTYALYIYWLIMMFVRLQERKHPVKADEQLRHAVSVMNGILIYRYASVTMFLVIAVILQNHLFIWSVISPKLCYEAAITQLTNILFLLVALSHAIDHQRSS
jgi:ethanolaminephosphotransferase